MSASSLRRPFVLFALVLASSPALAAEPSIGEKPFDVQSGVIEVRKSVKSAAVTSKTVETFYFKDWGRVQARVSTETSSNKFVKGEQVTRKFTLLEGATLTTVDLDKKTGMRTQSNMAKGFASMNRKQATEMTNKMADAMGTKTKSAGQATVAGMPCEVTESVTEMGTIKQTTRLYLWKNILLKSESTGMGAETLEEAVSVKTGPVPAEKFLIPKGVTISEFKMP